MIRRTHVFIYRWANLLAAITASACVFASVPTQARGDGMVRVALLYRDQAGHREVVPSIENLLKRRGYACVSIKLPKAHDEAAQQRALRQLVEANPTIVASGGTKATLLALQTLPDIPVVYFMVPNALDAPFMAEDNPYRQRVAGITTDVSPEDQLDWILTLVPDAGRIGIPHSKRSARTASTIKSMAASRGIVVKLIPADKNSFADTVDRLNQAACDSALMIPDAAVYNSVSVQRLLLWGIRQKKPVLAFSANVVKAGALGAVYTDSQRTGEQVATLVQKITNGMPITEMSLEYPKHTSSAISERTAELISVSLHRRVLPARTVRFGGN